MSVGAHFNEEHRLEHLRSHRILVKCYESHRSSSKEELLFIPRMAKPDTRFWASSHGQMLIYHCQVQHFHCQPSILTACNWFLYKFTRVNISTSALIIEFRRLYKCPCDLVNHVIIIILLLLLLAQVTYNQVQPLRINYLASSHRGIKALIVSSIKIV